MSYSRLALYTRDLVFESESSDVAVGDTVEVIFGNGPHEGDRIGTATVTGFDEVGEPIVEVRLGDLFQRDEAAGRGTT